MAQYHFTLVPSRIADTLITMGYAGALVLAAASIYFESLLLLSALLLFAMSFDAERREGVGEGVQITACNENGSALNQAGQAMQICPPMIISPWLIMMRVQMVQVNTLQEQNVENLIPKTAPISWCRIWRDQLPIHDWARIRRIGITLNAPLRRA